MRECPDRYEPALNTPLPHNDRRDPLGTGGTLRFDGAGIADGSRSAIELTPVGSDLPHPAQNLALWAAILILQRFITEVGGRPDSIALFPIGQGHIGTNACVF